MKTVNRSNKCKFLRINIVALKKEYKLEYYFKANWFDASIFCRDHGMRLATINTDAEQDAINKLVAANGKKIL